MSADALTGLCLSFMPHLTAAVVPGEGVYLVSERGVTVLRGNDVTELAPFLDGTRDQAGLAAACAGRIAPERVASLVGKLHQAQLLSERAPGVDAFWTLAGLEASRVRNGRVAALTLGSSAPAALSLALRTAGLHVADDEQAGRHVALTVVTCDDYLDPGLEQIDAEHRAAGRPWLLVRATSASPWIGPVLGSADGPCWHCLANQLRHNRLAEDHLSKVLGREVAPRPAGLPVTQAAALNLAALEAAKWLAGHRYPVQRQIWELDAVTLGGRQHPVRRRPQCHACGDPLLGTRAAATPPLAAGAPVADAAGEGEPASTAQQLLQQYGGLVSPVTGLVRAVQRDPRGPEFLNCFHAWHHLPAGPDRARGARRARLDLVSSGKGVTATQAQASALCEALERHSGHYQGDEPVLRASFRALDNDGVHPDAVQLFHQRQFAERSRWNRELPQPHHVCDPFDEDAEIDWTPVWSLAGERRLLPTALLYYGVPQPAGQQFCRADSNGAAAGSSLAQALLYGLYELIERDSVALWWYNRTGQSGIDLTNCGDAWIGRLQEVHAGLGREVWALDLTSDLAVPVVAALSRRTGTGAEDIVLGFGAHLDPRLALRRALTELNQSLAPVADMRAEEPGRPGAEPTALDRWRTRTAADMPYLRPDPAARPATRHRGPAGGLSRQLGTVISTLAMRGMEVLALNQTRPDIGLPVVKVVVPGLRPHWARFAPGRLYDVPVRLGRLPAATAYHELNPVPLPV
jgi:oxazoline/thiazoline synthase